MKDLNEGMVANAENPAVSYGHGVSERERVIASEDHGVPQHQVCNWRRRQKRRRRRRSRWRPPCPQNKCQNDDGCSRDDCVKLHDTLSERYRCCREAQLLVYVRMRSYRMGPHLLYGDGPPILSYLCNQSKWVDASDRISN
jgi:hypothetical protein